MTHILRGFLVMGNRHQKWKSIKGAWWGLGYRQGPGHVRDLFPSLAPRRPARWPLSSGDMGFRTKDSKQLDRIPTFPKAQISSLAETWEIMSAALKSPRKGRCRNRSHH